MNPIIVGRVLYGADDLVGEWVHERMGAEKPSMPFVALGVTDGAELLGGVIFYAQRDNDIQLAVAVERPTAFLPRAVAQCLAYPFMQLGLGRVTAEIEADNARSLKLAKGLGFKREGTKRYAGHEGGHVHVMGLLRKDFRLKGFIR